jgi:hypothetical protein
MKNSPRLLRLVPVFCAAAPACRAASTTSSDPAAASGTAATIQSPEETANALVPDGLRGELSFEPYVRESHAYNEPIIRVVRPKGWVSALPADPLYTGWKSAGSPDASEFVVLAQCDGACAVHPWEAQLTKKYFTAEANDTVLDRDTGPGHGLMALRWNNVSQAPTIMRVAQWRDAKSEYASCAAVLQPRLEPALKAFEKACTSMVVEWK